MKLGIIPIVTSVLLLTSGADAWRVRFYNGVNYKGQQATWSGPGHTGTRCFNVNPLNNKISSLHYYAYNSDRTTKCCLTLYDSPGCKTKNPDWNPEKTCKDAHVKDIPGGFDNDISSFRTTCYAV
ncbi:hypothetical protein BDW59DRAFT_162544 [Aspergillus cavernicola]|uniref:Uncharacterized protein n=1 Tax=Aspergillus cavernicola TaxID=176166 RepID=A0ABR4I909_9EURO